MAAEPRTFALNPASSNQAGCTNYNAAYSGDSLNLAYLSESLVKPNWLDTDNLRLYCQTPSTVSQQPYYNGLDTQCENHNIAAGLKPYSPNGVVAAVRTPLPQNNANFCDYPPRDLPSAPYNCYPPGHTLNSPTYAPQPQRWAFLDACDRHSPVSPAVIQNCCNCCPSDANYACRSQNTFLPNLPIPPAMAPTRPKVVRSKKRLKISQGQTKNYFNGTSSVSDNSDIHCDNRRKTSGGVVNYGKTCGPIADDKTNVMRIV